jgi:NAD(P)-dependent dehydrogenase (short-subunit alcohol dehydrogenase family)
MNPPADSLTDKIALVTGAGSGLGEAIARLLAGCGAKVGLVDRDAASVGQLADELSASGGTVLALTADVTDADQLAAAVGALNQAWGRLDIVVVNAGINGVWAPLDELTPEEWDRTLDINLKGTFLTVRACTPLLKQSGGGSVIIISSLMGVRMFSSSGATAYAASKAAQVAFGRMIALELAKDKIRVNTVCPGAFSTNIMQTTVSRNRSNLHLPVLFPEGKVPLTGGMRGEPVQVARLVWFLASDLSDHITGTEIVIDGGQSLLAS